MNHSFIRGGLEGILGSSTGYPPVSIPGSVWDGCSTWVNTGWMLGLADVGDLFHPKWSCVSNHTPAFSLNILDWPQYHCWLHWPSDQFWLDELPKCSQQHNLKCICIYTKRILCFGKGSITQNTVTSATSQFSSKRWRLTVCLVWDGSHSDNSYGKPKVTKLSSNRPYYLQRQLNVKWKKTATWLRITALNLPKSSYYCYRFLPLFCATTNSNIMIRF